MSGGIICNNNIGINMYNSKLIIVDGIIIDNHNDKTINYNSTKGGGIFASHYSSIYLTGGTISSNSASHGGAIYSDTSTIELNGCNIKNNVGGICLGFMSSMTIKSGLISDNITVDGEMIYDSRSGDLDISGGVFENSIIMYPHSVILSGNPIFDSSSYICIFKDRDYNETRINIRTSDNGDTLLGSSKINIKPEEYSEGKQVLFSNPEALIALNHELISVVPNNNEIWAIDEQGRLYNTHDILTPEPDTPHTPLNPNPPEDDEQQHTNPAEKEPIPVMIVCLIIAIVVIAIVVIIVIMRKIRTK